MSFVCDGLPRYMRILVASYSVCYWLVAGQTLALADETTAVDAVSRPPNVILIMSDDQGYGDLGCHGNAMIRTPHLDRLYQQSVRFTDFHVDPTCSPTRAALLTGRYSTRTGVWHTVMGRSLMFHDEVTLADVLAANGYQNGIFGKWHLGDNYPMRPQERGFHHSVIHGGGGIGQTPDYWGNDYMDDHYLVNGQWRPFEGYCTDVFFDQAKQFIEQSEDQPFFVYLATNVPHSPFIVPERYQTHYREAGVPEPMASFYGMIENLDENVGSLLAWLEQTGRERDTIIIFITDNGTAAGVGDGQGRRAAASTTAAGEAADSPWRGFAAGMRGTKGSPYEGGHRVPLFIRWPGGNLGGGRDINTLTAHIDLVPTLVELCGLSFQPPNPLDGRSLIPLIRRPNAPWPGRTLFVHTQREEIPPKWRASCVMTQRWRYLNGDELYDLAADPAQQHDVAAEHPQVVTQLRQAYEQWWLSLQPALSNYANIVVGSEHANPTHLTCMDWHAASVREIPWSQPQIDQMPAVNGWWMLDVARPGRYAITLRHKPPQAAYPLRATRARVTLGSVSAEAKVPPTATSVTLQLDLPAGPAKLQTELWGAEGESRGAFFVDILREPTSE